MIKSHFNCCVANAHHSHFEPRLFCVFMHKRSISERLTAGHIRGNLFAHIFFLCVFCFVFEVFAALFAASSNVTATYWLHIFAQIGKQFHSIHSENIVHRSFDSSAPDHDSPVRYTVLCMYTTRQSSNRQFSCITIYILIARYRIHLTLVVIRQLSTITANEHNVSIMSWIKVNDVIEHSSRAIWTATCCYYYIIWTFGARCRRIQLNCSTNDEQGKAPTVNVE